MGTRADFYIGSGAAAEWLGSVGWDGYEWEEDRTCALMQAKTPGEFQAAVNDISRARSDFTHPSQGWPWPWPNSHATDYAYVLIDGAVHAYCAGSLCVVNSDVERDCDDSQKGDFPDMSARMNLTLGERSGLILVSAPVSNAA